MIVLPRGTPKSRPSLFNQDVFQSATCMDVVARLLQDASIPKLRYLAGCGCKPNKTARIPAQPGPIPLLSVQSRDSRTSAIQSRFNGVQFSRLRDVCWVYIVRFAQLTLCSRQKDLPANRPKLLQSVASVPNIDLTFRGAVCRPPTLADSRVHRRACQMAAPWNESKTPSR